MTQSINEREWLRQIADGDENAFKSLFDMYWDHIYTVANALTRSVDMSEDIVQEIFLKVWIKRKELEAVENLENYLFIIARNHIYNVLKKLKRKEAFHKLLLTGLEHNKQTPEKVLIFKESEQLLQQAISKLTTQQQTIYRMTRDQGLTHEQVARELNISTNTVRNHITNSLKLIRDYLKEHASDALLITILLRMLQ